MKETIPQLWVGGGGWNWIVSFEYGYMENENVKCSESKMYTVKKAKGKNFLPIK